MCHACEQALMDPQIVFMQVVLIMTGRVGKYLRRRAWTETEKC